MDIQKDISQWPYIGSKKTFAALLGINARTLTRWADAGKIRRFTQSKNIVFFMRDDIAKMLGLPPAN